MSDLRFSAETDDDLAISVNGDLVVAECECDVCEPSGGNCGGSGQSGCLEPPLGWPEERQNTFDDQPNGRFFIGGATGVFDGIAFVLNYDNEFDDGGVPIFSTQNNNQLEIWTEADFLWIFNTPGVKSSCQASIIPAGGLFGTGAIVYQGLNLYSLPPHVDPPSHPCASGDNFRFVQTLRLLDASECKWGLQERVYHNDVLVYDFTSEALFEEGVDFDFPRCQVEAAIFSQVQPLQQYGFGFDNYFGGVRTPT